MRHGRDGRGTMRTPCPEVVWVIELLLEVTGAILILVAFALAQFRGLDRHGFPYLVLNLVGCGASSPSLAAIPSAVGIPAAAKRLGARRVMGSARSRPPRASALVSADQVVQIVGAVLSWPGSSSARAICSTRTLMSICCSTWPAAAILAVLAFQGQRWGFVLLEGVWTLVALVGLIMRVVGKEPVARH